LYEASVGQKQRNGELNLEAIAEERCRADKAIVDGDAAQLSRSVVRDIFGRSRRLRLKDDGRMHP
jgi:hypothetical protein